MQGHWLLKKMRLVAELDFTDIIVVKIWKIKSEIASQVVELWHWPTGGCGGCISGQL